APGYSHFASASSVGKMVSLVALFSLLRRSFLWISAPGSQLTDGSKLLSALCPKRGGRPRAGGAMRPEPLPGDGIGVSPPCRPTATARGMRARSAGSADACSSGIARSGQPEQRPRPEPILHSGCRYPVGRGATEERSRGGWL